MSAALLNNTRSRFQYQRLRALYRIVLVLAQLELAETYSEYKVVGFEFSGLVQMCKFYPIENTEASKMFY